MNNNVLDNNPCCDQATSEVTKLAILALIENDRDAWEQLLPHIDAISRLVISRGRLRRDKAAVFQSEAYGVIFEKRLSFDPKAGSFEGWCYTVLYNRAVDIARKCIADNRLRSVAAEKYREKQEESASSEEADSFAPTISTSTAARPFCDEQLSHLERLPPKRRVIALAAVNLHRRAHQDYWNKWLKEAGISPPFPPQFSAKSPKEIFESLAAALGLSPQAVRQHVYRARDVLREVLAKDQE
ncbi:MAG: hypothetical protein NZ899_08035 [Thermoguttaceae bacterium]|nr:hypothetical protein [Thermoguttaceae bacterium]MDW8078106.1 hypothetical protein [Thermoguttaceae bacterium]